MSVREVIRNLIDNLRMAIPGGRQFLDKSKDTSEYDVDDPNLPLVNKTITIDSKKNIKIKNTKK